MEKGLLNEKENCLLLVFTFGIFVVFSFSDLIMFPEGKAMAFITQHVFIEPLLSSAEIEQTNETQFLPLENLGWEKVCSGSGLCKLLCEHQWAPPEEMVLESRANILSKGTETREGCCLGNSRHWSMTESISGERWLRISGKPEACLVLKVFTYQRVSSLSYWQWWILRDVS